ncbi:uncharacterized protein PV09_06580 [Verruconis gallopava]|uniref:Formin GTPase-binding domain-containing protein n=1 Tax=Verruconis gallopava TaxID=253628 RepID=A0A0D2A5T6_9PEZI|nr:uncharacterized protein PV09_06580 [Verruconis gallopava]KIW02088.1 hypothetical protein PV09_06580 [Verruconis gallopava]
MEPAISSPVKEHRRNRSAVLKSMVSKASKRDDKGSTTHLPAQLGTNMPFLPPDHPHAQQKVLGEIESNHNTAQPRRPASGEDRSFKGLHKRTKSAVSLRSLGKSKDEKTKEGTDTPKSTTRRKEKGGEQSPGKKSSTGLTSMFKGRSSRETEQETCHSDKENSTPPKKQIQPAIHTPIYAAYATTQHQEATSTTTVPLNDREKKRAIIEEIALYDPNPQRMVESHQRNFYGYDAKVANPIRPKSEVISDHALGRFLAEPAARKPSNGRRPMSYIDGGESRKQQQDMVKRSASRSHEIADQKSGTQEHEASSGSRVREAVARINRRTVKTRDEQPVDPEQFAASFDAMLEARNIPDLVRQQMRELDQHVKQALLRSYEQDLEASRGHSSSSERSFHSDTAGVCQQVTPIEETASNTSSLSKKDEDAKSESKKSRPRSRTFTFKKNDKTNSATSPTKKQRTDSSLDMKHTSQPNLASPTLLSTSPAAPSGSYFANFVKKNVAEDYVKYLQKHPDPQDAEVGKLHKLRQLLRNETVAWVNKFIELGGMSSLVDLIHRLMEIEWREERDDQLLNEALLCLKALCTTDLALQKLCEIESTLFPALLAMLFDKEHRGPSEFTTRQIVFNILLAHLEAAVRTPDILPSRARTILSYLADQTHPDKRNPLPFDLEVGPRRPYKIWNREVSNVTKEVFWVWLHPLNLIPYPHVDVQVESTGCLTPDQHPTVRKCPPPRELSSESYTREFFPRPRPPVPAAPYIGGVEWDATNYLATHIDLLNGLIASLPTREERNTLREELRASGFERTMGEKLRQCKEKYYGAVHDVLRTWVAAAVCDGWDVKEVRQGPPKEETSPRKTSPRKSPAKKMERPPQLEAPPKLNLDIDLTRGGEKAADGKDAVDAWL